jgi:hypothetical protein
MPNGRPTPRSTPRLARELTSLAIVFAFAAGCERLPLRGGGFSPDSWPRPATRVEPASVTSDPDDMPPLPRFPLKDSDAEASSSASAGLTSSPESGPSAAPLRDSALAQTSDAEKSGLVSPADATVELPPSSANPVKDTTPKSPQSPQDGPAGLAPAETPVHSGREGAAPAEPQKASGPSEQSAEDPPSRSSPKPENEPSQASELNPAELPRELSRSPLAPESNPTQSPKDAKAVEAGAKPTNAAPDELKLEPVPALKAEPSSAPPATEVKAPHDPDVSTTVSGPVAEENHGQPADVVEARTPADLPTDSASKSSQAAPPAAQTPPNTAKTLDEHGEPQAQSGPKVIELILSDTKTAEADLPPSEAKSTSSPTDSAQPDSRREGWSEGLGRLRELALQQAGTPGAEAELWTVRSQVLDWLAGEGERPNGSPGAAWTSVLTTLTMASGPETSDPALLAPRVREAVDALEALGPLRISDLRLCSKVEGFGRCDVLQSATLRAGQPILVYCEISGVRYEPGSDGFRSQLASRVEILPCAGGQPVWAQSLETAEDVCRRRRRDYYVNYRIVIPSTLRPGSYSLRLTQTDLLSGRADSAEVPFAIEP